MIKAVFLDWFNTLAQYQPPREELQSQALRESGIMVSPRELLPGVVAADNFYLEENALSPVEKREPAEQARIHAHYQNIILTQVRVKADQELLMKILKRVGELFKSVSFVLFDDVLTTLKVLKGRMLIVGLLTNASKNMISIYRQLGLEPYLDFVITSDEAGADKPNPPIFLAALERAKVNASEAFHVGDQYKIDILGARGVGINPILIDRYNLYPDVSDCPRIHNLAELTEHL